ncbi:hypothetical protein CR513_45311, partial [Mucuna pruriens]
MKGNVEVRCIVSALTKNEDFIVGAQALPKKYRDPRIFSVPCTIGRPVLMTARTKIDVHAGTLSMEFGDTLVQFNIFEAMKHPIEDHSLFGIDLIYELVEEYFQLDSHSEDIDNFTERTDSISCLGSISKEEADYVE